MRDSMPGAIRAALVAAVMLAALMPVGCRKPDSGPVAPADSVPMPARGFYMGVLPIPAEGQSFDSVYAEAGECGEFVPVWGRPTPFYELAEDLKGDWGKTFVKSTAQTNVGLSEASKPFSSVSTFETLPPESSCHEER